MSSLFPDQQHEQGTVLVHQTAAQEQQRQLNKAENKGGFECEFVECPPEAFQSECPICLQIIRDPYQVTCCGYSFCRSCIERIKTDNKPCPTCNVKGFSEFPNKGLKRSLYAFKVRCGHQRDGCKWTGELGHLDLHLNKDPPPEKRLDGCPLTTVNCDFLHVGCGVKPPRKDMPKHLRENLLTHISLLAVSHANLAAENATLRRKNADLEQNHRILETNSHSLQDKLASLQEKHTTLSVSHTSLRESHTKLSASHTSLRESHTTLSASHVELQAQVKDLSFELNGLKESHDGLVAYNLHLKQEVTSLSQKTKTKGFATVGVTVARTKTPLIPSAVLIMTDFQRHKIGRHYWFSPPVYTHHQGYKICLKVHPNGYGSGTGTHVSVFIHFMRGEFDDFLQWPFRGVISFRVLDQLKGVDHESHTISYDDTIENKYCSRPVYEERSHGWGSPDLIAHSQLKPKYLRNDNLQLQVYDGEVHV